MPINYAWVLAEWNKFLDMTERVKTGEAHPTRSGEIRHVYRFKVPDDEVKQQLRSERPAILFLDLAWRTRSLDHPLLESSVLYHLAQSTHAE